MSVEMHLKLVEEINKLADQLSRLTLSDDVKNLSDVTVDVTHDETPTENEKSTCETENGHAPSGKDMSDNTVETKDETSTDNETSTKFYDVVALHEEAERPEDPHDVKKHSDMTDNVTHDNTSMENEKSTCETENIHANSFKDMSTNTIETKFEISEEFYAVALPEETELLKDQHDIKELSDRTDDVTLDNTSTENEISTCETKNRHTNETSAVFCTVALPEDQDVVKKLSDVTDDVTRDKLPTENGKSTCGTENRHALSGKDMSTNTVKTKDQTNTDNETSAKFYAVALPEEAERPEDPGTLIYSDFKDAVKAVKSFKGSRFKEFTKKESALQYSSKSLDKVVAKAKVDEEGSSLRSATSQELCQLRKYIEKGDETSFARTVWNNPKTLVGSCDTPSIMQEGMRYNALHVAAKSNKPYLCQLVLDTIENPSFLKQIYPSKTEAELRNIVYRLLDLYVNTPDKKTGDTPLHYASKFGCIDCVKVLLAHPSCVPDRTNVDGFTAREIICSRLQPKSSSLIGEIEEVFKGLMYIPILRSELNDIPAVVGKPCPCKEIIQSNRGLEEKDNKSSLSLKAFIGPMSPKFAEQLYLIFKNPTSPKGTFYSTQEMKLISKIRFTDRDQGLERIGRWLADDLNFQWQEYFSFLNIFTNLALDNGLKALESHFENKRDIPNDPEEMSIFFVHQFPSHVNPLSHYVNVQLELKKDKNYDSNYDDVYSTPPCSPMKNPDGDCFVTPPSSPTRYSEKDVFLQGASFSKLDADTYLALSDTIVNTSRYPNVSKWKSLVERERKLGEVKEPNTPSLNSLSLLTSTLRLNDNVCTPQKTVLNKAFRFENSN